MAKRGASAASSTPSVPVFLVHGEDEAAMGQERSRLIGRLIAEEMRSENVTEFSDAGGGAIKLKKILPDLLDELSTASFFPEHRRVAVVANLHELTAKATKESTAHCERLADFLRNHLAEINNAAIFIVREDSESWKSLQKSNPICKAIQEVGEVRHFPSDNLNFAFQDALLARDAGECIRILELRLEKARSSDKFGVVRGVFNELVRVSRFLIQAKVAQRDRSFGPERLPDDKRLNLFAQHRFVQGKITKAAQRFSLSGLVASREALLASNRHFAPSLEDTYVADQRLMLEHLIVRLCA